MAVYDYVALDTLGKEATGIIDADSPPAARRKLRDHGLFPQKIKEVKEAEAGTREISLRGVLGGTIEMEVALATRQLAVLLEAGMPLVEGLGCLVEQVESPRLRKVLFDVRERVSQGSTFADALAAHKRIFMELYANMVEAGESSGALEVILFRLGDFLESQIRLKNRIKSAMVYPCVMMFMGSVIVIFLMGFVVPKVSEVFDQFQRDLPVMTEVLISTCDFIRAYWWLVLLLVFGAVMTIRQYKKTAKGRRWWDGLVLRLPTVGSLALKLSVARFARTLGTLVQSGLPMLTALDIVKRIVANAVIEEAIEDAKKGVRKGEDLATPLRASKVFPPILIHMVALGEKSGQLESMLVKVADSYEEEVDMTVNTLVSLLEPLMVMVMGVFVGFMVLAILLPIFDLSQAVG